MKDKACVSIVIPVFYEAGNLDELIGKNKIAHENYNETIFSLIKPGKLNVLTIQSAATGSNTP
jgi:hypothetical protein